jgi:hypothetical protein
LGISFGDHHFFGESTDRKRIPRLAGIANSLATQAGGVGIPALRVFSISGAQHEQAGKLTIAIVVRGEPINGGRPRRGFPPVTVIVGCNRRRKYAWAQWRYNFGASNCFGKKVPV